MTETSWTLRQRKKRTGHLNSPRKETTDRKSRQIQFKNQTQIAKELTKESSKMNLTVTSWNQEQMKKDPRFLSRSRKEKLERKSRQIPSLNQTLTAMELTKGFNKMNMTITSQSLG